MNEINFKKLVNLSAVAEYPPTVKSASKALYTSTALLIIPYYTAKLVSGQDEANTVF